MGTCTVCVDYKVKLVYRDSHQSCQHLQERHALQVEAAYDVILMQKMRDRLSGDVKASIKYADVPVKKNSTQV